MSNETDTSNNSSNEANESQKSSLRTLLDDKYVRALMHVGQNLERYLMYFLYIYIITVVFVEVLRRYGLGMSSLWSGETARYTFIYITYIGISWATYNRAHIRIDILLREASQRVRGYLYILSDFVMLLFAVYAIRYTLPLIQTSINFGAKTQALQINRAFAQVAILVGFSLMIIRVLQRAYQDIVDVRADREPYTGEAVFDMESKENEGE